MRPRVSKTSRPDWWLLLAIFIAGTLGTKSSRADERLWLEGKINDQPARMIFDTGADRLILFKEGADRLHISYTNAPADMPTTLGSVKMGVSEPVNVSLLGTSIRTVMGVFDMPSYIRMRADGVVGWYPLSGNVLLFDALALRAFLLPDLPGTVTNWTRLNLRTNSGYLFLEVPTEDNKRGLVLVDTGFTGGVAVGPKRWREWVSAHTNAPVTLDSYFMPGAGLVVRQEGWADEVQLGPLKLTQVPLQEANFSQLAMAPAEYQASIGLAAIKRLEMIIDGPAGAAYLKPKNTPPVLYDHNRLGAVFMPLEKNSTELVARVVRASPAYEAGIRNGDVLLKVGDLDVTKWRTDPKVLPLSRFWSMPSGMSLELLLKRGSEVYKTRPLLRHILGPKR